MGETRGTKEFMLLSHFVEQRDKRDRKTKKNKYFFNEEAILKHQGQNVIK